MTEQRVFKFELSVRIYRISASKRLWRPQVQSFPLSRGGIVLDQEEIRQLADSMVRLYGKTKSFNLADRYASEAAGHGDQSLHNRWAAVAALLAASIELELKYASSSR